MSHKFYNNWEEFWEFYISKIKDDIGINKMKVLSYSQISKKLPRIPDREVLDVIVPMIREHGYITDSITLRYDPNATTFYSTYDKSKRKGKRVIVGFPTFTRYMIHWKPAIEAAFRHELGHILRKDIFQEFNYGSVKNANTCMDIRINANLNRESLTSVYKCLYYKDKPVELLVPEEQFYKINLPYDEKNPYVPGWRVICDHYNDANQASKEDKEENGDTQEQESGFNIGDLVVIDSESSKYNNRFGKIIEIDNQTGEYIVEEASDEEVDEALENNYKSFSSIKDVEYFGAFNEDELLPIVPQDEGGGEYGDDDDEDSGDSGQEEEDSQETQDAEGEGEGEDEEGSGDNESSIERKEEILENLKNGGVDGEPTDQPFLDDDEDSTDWGDKYDESENESSDNEDESKEEGKGDGETEDGESEDGESEDGESEDGEDGESEDGESKKPGKEKSDREKELEERIKESGLKKRIKESFDNFSKIKENFKDVLTDKEIDVLNSEIEELNKLL